MNTRIQELALQAGEYVNSVYQPPVRSKTPGKIWEDGHIGWHTQFNEKFAELLVQECLSVVNDCTDCRRGDAYWDKAVEFIERDLKKHFGDSE